MITPIAGYYNLILNAESPMKSRNSIIALVANDSRRLTSENQLREICYLLILRYGLKEGQEP